MLVNYILAGAAGLFLILCVLSAVSECSPSAKALPRNVFRRIRITLRGIGPLLFFIAATVLVVTSLKFKKPDIVWTACSTAAAAIGLLILNSFRIFGRRRSRSRRRKRHALRWVKALPETANAAELSECACSPTVPERTVLPTPVKESEEKS